MILRGCGSSDSIFGFFILGSMLRLPLHRTPEKGRKDCPTPANIPVKGGHIEVNAPPDRRVPGMTSTDQIRGLSWVKPARTRIVPRTTANRRSRRHRQSLHQSKTTI